METAMSLWLNVANAGRSLLLGVVLGLSSAAGWAADGMAGAPSAPKPPSGPNEVSIGFNVFVPTELTVPVGTTVKWVNNDGSNHNVVFKDATKSGRLRHDATYSRTFAAAGIYEYECAIHGAMMSGRIVVE